MKREKKVPEKKAPAPQPPKAEEEPFEYGPLPNVKPQPLHGPEAVLPMAQAADLADKLAESMASVRLVPVVGFEDIPDLPKAKKQVFVCPQCGAHTLIEKG